MNFSGHGLLDLASYDAYLSGRLEDSAFREDDIARLVKDLEKFPRPSVA